MNEQVQYLILVTGKVQGVFFRASAKHKALDLNLTGWVKNLPTGQVEILVQGEHSMMEQFLKWCSQGPQFSHVENVKSERSEFQEANTSFEIVH